MRLSSITAGLAVSTVSATEFGQYKRASNSTSTLQWLGVNEAGAEFGNLAIPGQLGKDYTWPNK
jgi:endoglucanase